MAAGLALGASLAWGLADFLGGLTSRRLPVLLVLGGQQAVTVLIAAAIVAVAGETAPGGDAVLIGLLSGAFHALGMAAYYQALATGVMGVVAPISAAGAIVPLLAGLLSGDDPSGVQLTGMVLAVAGVTAAAYQRTPDEGLERRRAAVGAGMAIVAAICIGSFFVLLDLTADRAELSWAVLSNRVGAIVTLGVLAIAIRERLRGDGGPGAWRPSDTAVIVLIGSLAASATLLFAAATTRGLISVVSVIGALYPVATIVLAQIFLGERMRGTQRAGALVALLGVAMIAA